MAVVTHNIRNTPVEDYTPVAGDFFLRLDDGGPNVVVFLSQEFLQFRALADPSRTYSAKLHSIKNVKRYLSALTHVTYIPLEDVEIEVTARALPRR